MVLEKKLRFLSRGGNDVLEEGRGGARGRGTSLDVVSLQDAGPTHL